MTISTERPVKRDVTRLISFAQAARAMTSADDTEETLRLVVEQTAATFADVAVSLVLARPGGRPGTPTVSDRTVARAEALQVECGEGSSYWVLQRGTSVRSDDLRLDPRWRFWGPQAAGLGLRSLASVPVWDGAARGVLTAYSTGASAFSSDDVVLLEVYAVHVSIALSAARERRTATEENLMARAEGMLVERFHVDTTKAAAALRLHAVRHQIDPVTVARDLVDHRTLTPTTTAGPVGAVRLSSPASLPPRTTSRLAARPARRWRAWVQAILRDRSAAVVDGAM